MNIEGDENIKQVTFRLLHATTARAPFVSLATLARIEPLIQQRSVHSSFTLRRAETDLRAALVTLRALFCAPSALKTIQR